MRGPIHSASTIDPMPADPTHHQAARPSRYPRPVAPIVDPPPMLAARHVAKISPGPRRRPATKKSPDPRTRRLIHRPSAICASEYTTITDRNDMRTAGDGNIAAEPP